jgi:pyridoxal phosphate enzyme (YggS family)
MPVNKEAYNNLISELSLSNTRLVAVSKTRSIEEIKELYDLGQRDFGENYVQELVEKQARLPNDIQWHFIGHLQTNKIKHILSFVHLIHGVDSLKLLKQIDKEARKINKLINCLLQIHIAQEETKFGLDKNELSEIMQTVKGDAIGFRNTKVRGLMGMASLTDNATEIKNEFRHLKKLFDDYNEFEILSMGMTADYKIAIEEGATLVRIGSLLFGNRA